MSGPDVALVACRFLFDGSLIFLWGTSAFVGFVVQAPFSSTIASKLWVHQRIAAAILAAATVALLPLRAATIGDGWGDAVDLQLLQSVLTGTNIGLAWLVQAFAVLLVILLMLLGARQAVIAALCLLLAATLAMTGHAAMDQGWIGIVHRANDILHLLAAGLWLGALVPVLVILPLLATDDFGHDAAQALARFSGVGHFAVAIVAATGLANAYLIVGGLPIHWSVAYQALLSAKIALVGVMVALALVNRYALVPRLATAQPQALSALARSTRTEILLGFGVILLVAWFGTLDPS